MPDFALNFPDYAQSSFERLCDLANVTKTRSVQDREGWDYLVEFARTRVRGLPHDQQPGNATVRVQIKSKTAGKPTARVSLTNALRFANGPDPCFVVLWWRTADHGMERIYARHFDEALIGATLRRAREAQRDGRDDLHRLSLSFSFGDGDDHTDDLLPWIRSIGDTDPHDYGARKRELARKLGFGPDWLAGNVKLPYDDVQKLIDAAVGLPTERPDVEVTLGNRRFDIVTPVFGGKPDFFNMSVEPRPGRLTFRSSDGRTATFEGEVRTLGIPELPLETVRATFRSPGMSGIVRGQEFKIDYHLGGDDRHPLGRLQNLAQFMTIAGERCTVALELGEGGEPLEAECGPMAIDDPELFTWLEDALGHLRACCGPDDDPMVRAADVINDHDEVVRFAIAGAAGTPTFDLDTAERIELPLVTSLVAFRALRIGGTTYYAVLRRACLDQRDTDTRIHFRFNDPVELESGILTMDEEAARVEVEMRFARLAQRVGKGALILNGGDYLSLMRGEPPAVQML